MSMQCFDLIANCKTALEVWICTHCRVGFLKQCEIEKCLILVFNFTATGIEYEIR